MRKRKLVFLLIPVLLIGLGAILLFDALSTYREGAALYEGIEEEVTTVEENALTIDWETLLAENPDIVGWIRLDPDISYPVVRGDDNDEYLRTGIDGEYNVGGSIFMDSRNTSWTDPHILVYGHHMRNNTMFGKLDLYQDSDFAKEHREITVYTPEHTYHYRLSCIMKDTDGSYAYTMFDTDDFDNYFSYCSPKALWMAEDETEGPILTLSTCIGASGGLDRLLLQAVLIED